MNKYKYTVKRKDANYHNESTVDVESFTSPEDAFAYIDANPIDAGAWNWYSVVVEIDSQEK